MESQREQRAERREEREKYLFETAYIDCKCTINIYIYAV
jgi:hypothetical protein